MKQTIRLLLVVSLLVAATSLRAALYVVGSAINTGWDRQPMTEHSAGIYEWSGYLSHGGELKFMTQASDWGTHWGPSTANARLTPGSQGIALHTSGDYKYRVDNVGYCRLLVDTNAGQIHVADSNGHLPQAPLFPPMLYPSGTAVGAALSDSSDFALRSVSPHSGIYAGRLFLGTGTLSLHAKPYAHAVEVRPVAPWLASGASTRLPKLRYSLETDKCSYAPGETVRLTMSSAPPSGTRVRYRHLGDVLLDTLLASRQWEWQPPADDFRGYLVEVYRPQNGIDNICATIAVDVSSSWTRFPRYGFVASFGSDKTATKVKTEIKWLNRCHINGVQFQDWHYCHDWPLGASAAGTVWTTYKDVANRTIYTSALRNYIKAQHERGMKSIFYNLCHGALDGWQERGLQPEWFIYKDRNHADKDVHDLPETWKSDIYLLNPANEGWLAHLAARNDDVYATLDFDGYQIDQLGPRGTVYDYDGNSVDLRESYASFISYMKNRRPEKHLVMNAVSGWGTSQMAGTGKVDFLYNEVWGNLSGSSLKSGEGRFANLKSVIDQNRSLSPTLRTVLAAYMNYVSDGRNLNTPGIVMADAVIFALGGAHLELGGDHMLCREYFPYDGMKWHSQLEDWMTRYYDFLTAYENLLRDDWKEKTNVRATCADVGINTWEPKAGQVTLLAREVDGRQVVHLLNFTHETTTADVDSDYLLCWHDNQATRPWPQRMEDLTVRLTGMSGLGTLRRVWAASPDYMGGAVQELTDYTYSSATGVLTVRVPALHFWTMIVAEPERTTTADDVRYAPASSGETLVPGIASSLVEAAGTTSTWSLQLDGAPYEAQADIPAGTLTLQRENDDAIVLPIGQECSQPLFTPAGLPADGRTRGLLIGADRKVVR